MINFLPPIFAKPLSAFVALVLIAIAQHPAASTDAAAQEIVQGLEALPNVPALEKQLEPADQTKTLEKAPAKLASPFTNRRALIVCGVAGDEDYL